MALWRVIELVGVLLNGAITIYAYLFSLYSLLDGEEMQGI